MPLRDIIKEYREAKNPKKQIDILADLNHTKGCRIAWLLDRCGEAVDKVKLPRKSRDTNAPDLDMIWRDTPLGVEAAQINMERKHRIMEEKTMNKETDTGCPAEVEENPLAWVEKVIESEVPAEECPKNEDVVKEVALPEEEKCVERVTVPDKVCPVKRGNLAEMITAEFWQIYLSHTFCPVNDADVAAMLTLANIAERLTE
jgi:hypothetical protein